MKLLPLSVAFALVVSLACGSSMPPKSACALSCSGCCTSAGFCVSGQTSESCGKGGKACTSCDGAQMCTAGACVMKIEDSSGGGTFGDGGGAGGGGGFAGGGAVGGGFGGGGGCLVIDTSGIQSGAFTTDGTIDEEDAYVQTAGSNSSLQNLLWISEYYSSGTIPPAPRTVELTATTWSSCSDCIEYSIDCDTSTCAEDYLAQSGTFEIDEQTLDGGAGVFSGVLTTVHLVQWDGIYNTSSDGPTPGGKCIDLISGTFNATWP